MRKAREIDPRLRLLQLSFALSDSCMAQLSANAWKVVSYIASQCLRLCPEQLLDPAITALHRDLESIGIGFSSSYSDSGEMATRGLEARAGVEPANKGFADLSLSVASLVVSIATLSNWLWWVGFRSVGCPNCAPPQCRVPCLVTRRGEPGTEPTCPNRRLWRRS